jgi:5-(hydroxymethyl)furfural/furfural oxidase
MYMMAAARSAWHPLGRRIGSLIAWINKPHSRGVVSLRREGEALRPLARFEFLADPRDAERLADSLRLMARLLAAPPLAEVCEHASPSRYSGFAKALGRQSLRNFLLTAPTALAIDVSAGLRRGLFRRFVAGGSTLADLLADPAALGDHVRQRAFGQWHACGTCRMGAAEDRDAVIGARDARVHGVQGLRVVDASAMPAIPRANLNIPVLMIAEKFADAIRRDDA